MLETEKMEKVENLMIKIFMLIILTLIYGIIIEVRMIDVLYLLIMIFSFIKFLCMKYNII